LDFRTRYFEALLAEKLLVKEVIQWAFFLEELFVVGKVYGREYPFEKVAPTILFNCFPQALFFFL